MVTEFASQDEIVPGNFPRRNRIVAGMSDAVGVVETRIHGGAVITAKLANSYHRDVFALPGSIHEVYSAGCNHLIKSHQAALLESIEDLAYAMGWEVATSENSHQMQLPINLTEAQQALLDRLDRRESQHVDDLLEQLNWSSSILATIILELEMLGMVKSLPGKRYLLN
jgi:DNA processing protein